MFVSSISTYLVTRKIAQAVILLTCVREMAASNFFFCKTALCPLDMVNFNCIVDVLCVSLQIWPLYFRAKSIFLISVPKSSVRRAFKLINDELIFLTLRHIVLVQKKLQYIQKYN
jgi:hypothetical protein